MSDTKSLKNADPLLFPFQIRGDLDAKDFWEAQDSRIKQVRSICLVVAENSRDNATDSLWAAVDLLDQIEALHVRIYASIKPGAVT